MDVREGIPQQEVGEAGTMADTDWKQRDFLSGTFFFSRSPRHLSTHMSPITHKHSQRQTQRCRRPHHLSSSSAPFSHPFLFYLKVLEKTAASVYVPHLSRFCSYLFLILYSGIVGVQIVLFFTPPADCRACHRTSRVAATQFKPEEVDPAERRTFFVSYIAQHF